ncbi:Alanyl-tRNA synthetase [hydrothermal vent metagenome]|uniref:Alanine--tRNA ligase n=1 Tax=hydrothermal vent metagenome TaxID=652676 RepID=A0A3B0VFP4_9ZZZZ
MYSTADVRTKFIEYFNSKQHTTVASSSLVPADDPTLLFVNAGMVQFKNLFLGAKSQQYSRVVTSQKCVRAGGKHNDLDQVGYTARHHTFFEMLGNFSFGDYFKQDAIHYAWDFLTNVLQIPKEKLLVTVFEEDDEAMEIWIEQIGIAPEKVLKIGAKDNFWQMGDTGPCGPCSEIFYDHGEDIAGGPPGSADEDGDRFIEIWNLVFMQFDRQADGELLPLPKVCVDTGMGLERITSILQGQHNNYDIDLFQHIIKYITELLALNDDNSPSLRVIADHIRTCAFLISDGIMPGNEGRGYVLRRIIRRAIRHGYKLGATDTFFYKILTPLIEVMADVYPELRTNKVIIENALKKEEIRFAETLETGMGLLNRAITELKNDSITGEIAFKLYDTYGFPLDLTQDIAREQQLSVDVEGFNQCMAEQKQRSKSSGSFAQDNQLPSDIIARLEATNFVGHKLLKDKARVVALIKDHKSVASLEQGDEGIVILNQTPFYAESGGQVGDKGTLVTHDVSMNVYDTQTGARQFHLHLVNNIKGLLAVDDMVTTMVESARRNNIALNHTATHLLHKVLQDKLGAHIQQKGSIVSSEKLRFDFSHPDAINNKQLQEIESEVNKHIRANHNVQTKLMSFDAALATGATALFGEKYSDEVRVLDIGGYSIELCGGTHVKATGEIGVFKIVSESSIAAGIRRIEAITGAVAISYLQGNEQKLNNIVQLTHCCVDTVEKKIGTILNKNKQLEKTIQALQSKLAGSAAQDLWTHVIVANNVSLLFTVVADMKLETMRSVVDDFKAKYNPGIVVLANHAKDDKVQLICSVSKTLDKQLKAGDIIKKIAYKISGKGGGRADFAQGGGVSKLKNLQQVLDQSLNELTNLVNI